MNETPSTDPIDPLIAAYVQAVETGQAPDRLALIKANPDHANALLVFFADFDRVDRVAAPLRMAGDDETQAVDSGLLAVLPTVRYFGDYELLEEIARGGMGVVYKARQTSLNRLVALKMILAGTFATPREVARFQAEAEAAANLDHPGIVPVYEVGEYEGQQYFSMKFIEGGSLAHHPRGPIKLEVLGLIAIARAVHHAHQHGVLHRDLKPANVLVDPKGDRHVTDFGLAKRLADIDRSMTEAGQILGTPRYMSPEQAAGRKDLTVAADVYALGVILFERLTGRTPFDGLTVLDILRQVRESDPPRPSTLRPELDRDLETVVLKCLEKDPICRYSAADGLAEDLDRWNQGRPINARPVGQAERFVRWCRRNPLVAGLAASVAAALILGIFVSILFALRERDQAIIARKAEGAAILARDDTERTYARSLVRPFNLNGETYPNPDALLSTTTALFSEPEVDALWELSSQSKTSFGLRFLDEAFRDPLTLRQLLARSEAGIIAAIGLEPYRQAEASRRLLKRMEDSELPLATRAELAFLVLDLENQSDLATDAATEIVLRAMTGELPRELRDAWHGHLIYSTRFRNAKASARLFDAAIDRETKSKTQTTLAWALDNLAERLDSVEASQICALAARTLVIAIESESDVSDRGGRAWAIGRLSARLNAAEALLIAAALAEAIGREKSSYPRSSLVAALGAMSARLSETDASRACAPAARSLFAAMESGAVGNDHESIKSDLVVLSAHLDAAEARLIAKGLADAIERQTNAYTRSTLAAMLGNVSARLNKTEAANICASATRTLALALERETDGSDRSSLASGLSNLSARLEATDAARICAPVAESLAIGIDHEINVYVRDHLASALDDVSARLNSADASRVCERAARSLAAAIETETKATSIGFLTRSLGKLSARLDKTDSYRICLPAIRALAVGIERQSDLMARDFLSQALGDLATQLEPAEAGPIAKVLINAIEHENNYDTRSSLATALGDISAHLNAAEARPIALALTEAIESETEDQTQAKLATALASAMPKLDPADTFLLYVRVLRATIQTRKVPAAMDPVHFESDAAMAKIINLLEPEIALRVVSKMAPINLDDPTILDLLLSDTSPQQMTDRAFRLAIRTLQYGTGPAMIQQATESYQCRLSTAELVELLKMPTCLGESRRVVLKHLGNIHDRRFANHWEFVRFAQEKGLKLDFTSPPRRPDPKVTVEELLKDLPR